MRKVLVSTIIVISFFCMSTFAFEGDGSKSNPYVITDAAEFSDFAALVNQGAESYDTAHYELWSDIDFDGVTYVMPGTASHPFKGTFDGNGYRLCNIKLMNAADEYVSSNDFTVGAFGYAENALFEDLIIENMMVIIPNSTIKSKLNLGLIAGKLAKTSNEKKSGFIRCSTAGSITVVYNGADVIVGGICGNVSNTAANSTVVLENCRSDADITVTVKKNVYAGGLCGRIKASATGADFSVDRSLFTGSITVTDKAMFSISGGIVGEAGIDNEHGEWMSLFASSSAPVTNCYFSGKINGNGTWQYDGSICGYVNEVSIGNCYVEKDSFYCTNSTYCRGGSIIEASADEVFFKGTLGFDFVNDWEMCNLYPRLKYAHAPKAKVKDNRLFVSFGYVGDSFAVVALYDEDNRLLNAEIKNHKAGGSVTCSVDVGNSVFSYKVVFLNNLKSIVPIWECIENKI